MILLFDLGLFSIGALYSCLDIIDNLNIQCDFESGVVMVCAYININKLFGW